MPFTQSEGTIGRSGEHFVFMESSNGEALPEIWENCSSIKVAISSHQEIAHDNIIFFSFDSDIPNKLHFFLFAWKSKHF
jgi:hypothetical protein